MGYITKNGHTFFIPDVSDKENKPFLHDKKGMPIIKDNYRGYDWKELLKHRHRNVTLPDGSPDPDRAFDEGLARKFRNLSKRDQNRFLNADTYNGGFNEFLDPEDRIGEYDELPDSYYENVVGIDINPELYTLDKNNNKYYNNKTPARTTAKFKDGSDLASLEHMRDLHASTGDFTKFYGKNRDGTPNLEEY